MSSQIALAIGVVTAALIAGFFSYLNLIISKEQKVSEFRQAWIDKVRDDISLYISSISFLAASHHNRAVTDEKTPRHEYMQTIEKHFENASRAYTSITLRINLDDKNPELKKLNKALLDCLEKVKDAVLEGRYKEGIDLAPSLRNHARPILKIEWERVKSGEKIYRWSRLVAAGILLAGLLVSSAGVMYYVKHDSVDSNSANKHFKTDAQRDARPLN